MPPSSSDSTRTDPSKRARSTRSARLEATDNGKTRSRGMGADPYLCSQRSRPGWFDDHCADNHNSIFLDRHRHPTRHDDLLRRYGLMVRADGGNPAAREVLRQRLSRELGLSPGADRRQPLRDHRRRRDPRSDRDLRVVSRRYAHRPREAPMPPLARHSSHLSSDGGHQRARRGSGRASLPRPGAQPCR